MVGVEKISILETTVRFLVSTEVEADTRDVVKFSERLRNTLWEKDLFPE